MTGPKLHFRKTSVVLAPIEEVFQWWTNYTEEDHQYTKGGAAIRRIVSNGDGEFEIEDEYIKPQKIIVRTWVSLKGQGRVEFSSVCKIFSASGAYSLTPEEGKTRIEVEVEVEPRGIWHAILLMPFAKHLITRYFDDDLDDHIEVFDQERQALLPPI